MAVAVAHLAGCRLTAEACASKVLDKLCCGFLSPPFGKCKQTQFLFLFSLELQTLPTQSKCYNWVVCGTGTELWVTAHVCLGFLVLFARPSDSIAAVRAELSPAVIAV